MAIDYKIDFIDSTLHVKAWGADDSIEDVSNYSKAIYLEMMSNEARKIICDERDLEYRLSTMETFQLAQLIIDNLKELDGLAIVPSKIGLFTAKIYTAYLKSQGVNASFFRSTEDALNWLKNK